MGWRIERLTEVHNCRKFRCGEHQLDHYLRRYARENDLRGLGSTYVAVDDLATVLGYITLCTGSVEFESLPQHSLPRYPIPTLLIARLAVDRRAQGQGIGVGLVLEALRMAVSVADRIGLFAVTVQAKTPLAKAFYEGRFGFSELAQGPLHLYVTIADLRSSGL